MTKNWRRSGKFDDNIDDVNGLFSKWENSSIFVEAEWARQKIYTKDYLLYKCAKESAGLKE